MLIDKGAKLENGSEHPLLTALSKGSRECFVALIDGKEGIVLNNFQDHSLAYHAIQYDTTLLPLLAYLMQREHEKLLAKNIQTNITFPPSDLSSRDKKKFEAALKYEDHYLPYEIIKKSVKQYFCPWHAILDDRPIEDIIPEDDDITKEDHNDNVNYSTMYLSSPPSKRANFVNGTRDNIQNSNINIINNNANNIDSNVNNVNNNNIYSNSNNSNKSKSKKTNSNNSHNINSNSNNVNSISNNHSNTNNNYSYSKSTDRSKHTKNDYSSNYNGNDDNDLSQHSESEDISEHLTFSALDDEDDVLKTNSDPFKGGAFEWVPLSQRKQKSQVAPHYSDKKRKKKHEEEIMQSNSYDELSEPTYEQSDIIRTDVAIAGNDDYSDNNDGDYGEGYMEYGYEEDLEEEEEEEEEFLE